MSEAGWEWMGGGNFVDTNIISNQPSHPQHLLLGVNKKIIKSMLSVTVQLDIVEVRFRILNFD